MRKTIAALALVPLLVGGATACSSSGSSGDSTSPTTGGGSAVDTYCENVAAFVEEAKKVADPQSADGSALREKAKALATQATELTAELISDPSAAARVQECTQQLQEAAQ